MKSPEYDMRRSAVQVITVLSCLLLSVTGTMVYLVNNEFEAERQLNEMHSKLDEFQQEDKKAAEVLNSKKAELAALRLQLQQGDTVHNNNRLSENQNQNELLDRISSAETEAMLARKAAVTAQGELLHAIEQSRKLEDDLKAQLARVQKEKPDTKNSVNQESVDITALKQQLNTTLQQLAVANGELLALRSDAIKKKHPTITAPPAIPVPATKLSSPPVQSPLRTTVFGQVKAVEPENHFVVIQLNTSKGVLSGDSLAVTRQGIPVGILKVYRVGPQNVVFTALTPDLRGKVRVGDQVNLRK